MGQPKTFEPEKLVVAVLASATMRSPEVVATLERQFGPADLVSDELPFGFTDYYRAEMGDAIRRFFFSARRLVAPDHLASIKLSTNALEEGFGEAGRRRVNLDPGLLSLSRFMLASTKPGSHRVPLAQGIYAEITLVYERGGFRALEWTYPDYRSPGYLAVLQEIRELYRRQRRGPDHEDTRTRSLTSGLSSGRPPRRSPTRPQGRNRPPGSGS
jgi:hypothetical protein